MNVSYSWGDEAKTHIIQDFSPGWTWDDFYQVSSEVTSMMRTVDHTVHIISDFRDSGSLPMGSSITHARNVINNYPANWGQLIVVSDSVFIRSMVGAFRRLFSGGIGGKTHAAHTMEEALAIIEQYTAQQQR